MNDDSICKICSNSEIENKIVEYRCPKCWLIPFINLSLNENKLFMTTKCTNNHNYSNSFDEMKKILTQNTITNNICEKCEIENINKKINEIEYYCSICFKFFCSKHGKNHKHQNKIINIKNIDNICYEHSDNSIIGYCSNHNKNYCMFCSHFNENNQKLFKILSEEEFKLY